MELDKGSLLLCMCSFFFTQNCVDPEKKCYLMACYIHESSFSELEDQNLFLILQNAPIAIYIENLFSLYFSRVYFTETCP